MKLESLNLEKFKEKSLNNGQMHSLKGGGLVTGGGGPIEVQSGGKWWSVCYTYDSIRGNGFATYHGWYNIQPIAQNN